MINIRPVTDLRYKFSDIENDIETGEPVFLTKNGYGSMVVMSLDTYSRLVDPTEELLDEADFYARINAKRLSHDEVFSSIRKRIHANTKI